MTIQPTRSLFFRLNDDFELKVSVPVFCLVIFVMVIITMISNVFAFFSIPLFLSESQSFSFDLSLKTYLATLFLGLVSTGISFIAYVVLLQRSSPVQASSIIFLVPITGIFWGAIFLNENIDQKVILGSLCILVGIGLTNIFKPKKLLRD